jgi:hypothetical protein
MKADDYRRLIENTHQLLKNIANPDKKEKADGWVIKEIVGHLVDSCSNNHQRLARFVPGGNLIFPGYQQEEFVKRADYMHFDYLELVALWYHYNKLLMHIFERVAPDVAMNSTITIGENQPVSIAELLRDYFVHLEKHVSQIKRISDAG